MNIIVPAIIPQSLEEIRDALLQLPSHATEVQIDIVDGAFVPFTSWPYRGSGSVMLLQNFATTHTLEVDLMIQNPEVALPLYVEAGVEKVVIHLESVTDFAAIASHHTSHEYELGLSIRNDTPLSILEEKLQYCDYVQLMGIREIGTQGQPFDDAVLERISLLRKQHPDLLISIDGSVNAKTLPLLRNAGANRFVAGSSVFREKDPHAAYEHLEAI
jgi:ribulose-phosphate 3-epimerase